LHTSKIEVDFAKQQGDDSLPRPWSKHSQGSSANTRMLKAKGKLGAAQHRAAASNQQLSAAEVEQKKGKFREFLKLMGTGAGTQGEKQSWNDQFEAFMHSNEPVAPKAAKPEKDEENAENPEKTEGGEEEVKAEDGADSLVDDKRLFVMNLSYQVTKEEV